MSELRRGASDGGGAVSENERSRKAATMFRKPGQARLANVCFKEGMYRNDTLTGETEFALDADVGAREVVLEGFTETERMRVPMHRVHRGWVARIVVDPGWFFYRFRIDGRSRRDRAGGKLRTADGESWSLALIQAARVATQTSPA